MSAAWTVRKTIRFSHCDPAGIVYYPRYFDLLHEAKEDWLREAVGVGLPELIGKRHRGLPIVRLETEFLAPSRMGDEVDIAVGVARIGGASLELAYEIRCGAQRRLAARTVLVHIDLETGRPTPIDNDLRARLAPFHIEEEGA